MGFGLSHSAPARSSAARAALRGQARSYVCFGPIIPGGFARERLGACLDIASYKQGGRARLAQDRLARNKRRSGLAREAPRGRRSISQALNMSRRTLRRSISQALNMSRRTLRRSISQAQNAPRRAPGSLHAISPPTTQPATRQANSCRDMVGPVLCVYCNLCSPTLLCASVAPNGSSQPDSFCCSVPALKNPAPSSA